MESIVYESKKVLSIQSHVVHGYVGNKASTFPMQMLDWDVDVLNTVNFSNHTGYGKVHGSAASHDQIIDMFQGLRKIGIKYDALLTGYTADGASLKSVGEIGCELKEMNPNCLWLLDPVMGDEGQLYVSRSVIPIYRSILETGHVDVITPNQFEAELLLGTQINTIESLKDAVNELHCRFNLDHVVITSLSTEFVEHLKLNDKEESIYTVVSSKVEGTDSDNISFFKVPRLNSYFTGVGDLFSALLADRLYRQKSLVDSVDEVLTVMSKVLKITQTLTYQRLGGKVEGSIGDAKTMKECELRIVECKNEYCSEDKKFNPFSLKKFIESSGSVQ